MRSLTSRLVLVVIGLILLLSPLFVRTVIWGLNDRPYAVGQVPITSVAATPVPTATPQGLVADSMLLDTPMRPGPVVIDLAHGNRLTRSQFEPLSSALARRGVGTRFWLSDVDVMSLNQLSRLSRPIGRIGTFARRRYGAWWSSAPSFCGPRRRLPWSNALSLMEGISLSSATPMWWVILPRMSTALVNPLAWSLTTIISMTPLSTMATIRSFFPDDFEGQAERLAERRISLYGARSIGGEVTPLLRTAFTTLSSIRTGLTNFTTMALGGLASRGTLGRVLALSDFDALTNSYVERNDNIELVEFVAGFLAAAERQDTITDFPGYLGKEVALIFGNAEAVNAQILTRRGAPSTRFGNDGAFVDFGW